MYDASMSVPSPPLRLGPFRLIEPFASGGMGVIWRGVHEDHGVPVVVKVMVADELQSGAFRKAFRNEVWAMARLDHRGIVMVFDQGVIPQELADTSAGQLQAGAPYIVMDLVEGGTLGDHPPENWWELKSLLLLLLDALAHAHARGVIHRDLKPANVLVDIDTDGSGGLQLTDFGISHAAERVLPAEEGAAPVMGTLAYMSPEQMDGRWRDFGPWTDLYSLGCIAWELACGHLPFQADDPLDLMDQHLDDPPPALEPRFDVPEGFAEWVYGLMQKEPFDRPSRAADVARELKGLSQPEDGERTRALGLTMVEGIPAIKPAHLEELRLPTRTQHQMVAPAQLENLASKERSLQLETLRGVAPVAAFTVDDDETGEFSDHSVRAAQRLGLSWRRQRRPREWKRLAGVGLGLWGMRQPPLVGRDKELDAIWTALREAYRDHKARAVVLDGELGVGASRVALWLCERAHELGVADVLWATHSPQASQASGLSRMLAREFRCTGLSPAMRKDRIADVLERRDLAIPEKIETFAASLSLWMDEHRGSPVPSVSNVPEGTGVRPRFKDLYRFLCRMARRRPVVLWIDDAHWGIEALAFAWYVLRAQESKPADVLLLICLQSAPLKDDDETLELTHQIGRHSSTMQLPVPALSEDSQEHLLADLLGLERNLARKLAAGSGGNPLFATQLMGDWVRRGVLEPGPWGFRLRDGEDVSIPEDLPALWDQRIDQALHGLGPEAKRALVVAAAFGGRVETAHFGTVCARLGFTPPKGLADRLYAEHLAVPSKGGWSFIHDGLQVALKRRARSAGTWVAARRVVRERRSSEIVGDATIPNQVQQDV